MNKHYCLTVLIALFFSINLFAQFDITWQQTYGFASKSEDAKAVHVFADSSAIVAVARNTNDAGPLGNTRAEIFKYDAAGNTVWQTTLGGPLNDNLFDMIVDPNGDILTVGQNYRSTVPDTRSDLWIVKINSAGTVLWEKRIGGSSYDSGRSIIATSDGGYLVVGSTESEDGIINNRFNKPTGWIVKLDANGNVQWNRTYGGYGVYDVLSQAVETPQGDFIIGAAAFGFGEDVPATNGDYDFWIFKINSTGDIIWSKNHGGFGPEFVNSLNLLPDGSMIVSGTSNSHATGDVSRASAANTNFWIVKLDTSGDLIWEKSIGGDFFENGGYSDVSPSGEIYLAGTSNSLNGDITPGNGERDIWVFRLSSNGDILDKKNFGGSGFENAADIDLNGDHLFVVGGTGSSDGDVTGFSGGTSGDAWTLSLTTPTAPPTGCNPDVTPPVWSNCPADISVSNGAPTAVNWTAPTASDICSFANFTSNFASGYVFPLGTTRVIYTSSDQSNNTSTCEFNVTVQSQTGGGVDLELSVVQNDANPRQWSAYTVTATINNTGSQAANNVAVEWLSPNGVTYQGGNEFTASQGNFKYYSDQIWSVGTIPAGGSATLEVSYFLLEPIAPVSYAQVSSMNGTDADSTPGNGTCCTPNEDDEASTDSSGPPPSGKPDLEITNVQIPASIQAGSTFNAQVTVRNNGAAFNQPTLIQALVSFGIVEIKSTPTLNLAPGASQTFTLPFNMLGFNQTRQETMKFNIDILDTIDESDETNNDFDVDFQLTITNPPLVCNGNLLTNGDFENGLTGWTSNVNGHRNNPSNANSGTGSVQFADPFVSGTTQAGNTLFQRFSVAGNTGYELSFYARDIIGQGGLRLNFIRANGTKITGSFVDVNNVSSYQRFSISETAPADAVQGEVQFSASPYSTTALEVDDVCVQTMLGLPLPDLEITDVQIPASIQAGSTFNAQVTVRNNGVVDFNQPTLIQALVSFGIVEIKSTPTLNLVPGASQTFTLPFTMLTFNQTRQETMKFNIDILDTTQEIDETNNDFEVDFQLTVPNMGNGIDLELSLVQNDANPRQWNAYTVTATISNTGSQAANNVEVEWLSPNGVTYQGGNEFTASQGTFKYYSDQIWSVGTIPAGGSATMEVSYFLLQPTAPAAYAQVSSMSGTDTDSTPGNGTPPTPNEDDEASTSGGVIPTNQPDLQLSNLTLGASTVTAGNILNYNFNLLNTGNANVSGNYQIKAYISTDQTLSANDVQDGTVPTGNTPVGANISVPGASTIPANLPQGVYYLILVADDGNAIAESNESNNTIVSTTTFTVQGTTPPTTGVAPKKTVRVLVVFNDPVYQGQRFHQRFNWLNPTTLVNNLRDSMTAVSRGSVEYIITAVEYDDNIYTTLNGNLVPDIQSMAGYFEEPAWATLKQFEAAGQVRFDYNQFIDNNDLCTRFDASEYDDMWLYSYPIAGLWESTLAGQGAFFYNSQPVPNTSCLGLLPIMGFNYERGLESAMHSYGHRSENAMRQEYGRWDYNASNPNDWEKFTYYDQRKPGQAQVGNIHFPPNGTSDYDYGNTQSVSCQADNWTDYPNGNAPVRICSCGEWGCNELGYMAWWYRHLPNKDCLNPSGQLNDWWHYIVDYNQAQVREELLNDNACNNLPNTVDLAVELLDSPASVEEGMVYPIEFKISNEGLINSTESSLFLRAYISTTPNSQGSQVGGFLIPQLRSGVEIESGIGITIPVTTNPPGNYYLNIWVDSDEIVAESDEVNNWASIPITITDDTPPSGNGADLSMSIVTTTDIPQWANWSVTYVITNGSATTATGVKANLAKPDQVVYTGGNEFNTAQGTFDLYGTETWNVGTIAPGDQAVFTANYFRVSANPLTLYGQVTASDQSDPDSTPGNGSCCVANEDDEAARSLLAAFSGVNNRSVAFEANDSEITFMQSVFPNPTSERMTVRMIAKEASETEIQVIDNFGRILITESWQLEQGVNQKTIDMSPYPAGLYQVIAQPFHPYLRKARVMKVGN